MLRYYWLRLKPHFILFYGLELLLRLALFVRERANVDWHEISENIGALLAGFVNDSAVFAYILLLFCLYLVLLPRLKHGGRGDRIASAVFFFILATTLLFTHVSEWLFWDEFQTRFNFIAVDYLVYTQEVLANIQESYPVAPMIAAIGTVAALLTWVFVRYSRRTMALAPAIRQRGLAFGGVVILALTSFTFGSSDWPTIDDRYTDEIADNGIFEFFAAFNNNELDYAQFYPVQPKAEWLPRLQQQLGIQQPLDNSPIAKQITATAPEQKRNVVLIMVESLSGSYFAHFGNTDGVTPNLDRLADQSLFATNLYATGTRTVYGLSSAALSIPPLPGNSIVRRPENGDLASLGELLNSKGYVSKFIYGGYGYFDNMNAFFGGNGYRIADRASFTQDEVTFSNAWGVCDEDLFNHTLRENDAAYAAGQPFFDMIMTTSNHRPFTYPAGKIDIAGGRLGGVKYTDYAINKFIDDARSKPWFANTIFVIVADHTAGSAGKTELAPDKYHIPLMFYAPGFIKPQTIDSMASQIDMVPTLLGLMNMSYESRFYGVDLQREQPNRAFISNYQKLGYMTPDGLVILKPVKQTEFYKEENGDFVQQPDVPTDMLDAALAYYQGANEWRSWNHKP